MIIKPFLICSLLCGFLLVESQVPWQQRVEYDMNIDFDVLTHRFSGIQQLTYFNNSPDTITQLFYHLYFNAFQPGSEMDMRNRNIPDPDLRLSLIQFLGTDEIGYLHISALMQDTRKIEYKVYGTILEAFLAEPLYPGMSATIDMQFTGQVPKQIRRSGRHNAEGIAYSMSQWYPKLCAYDRDGWHPNPYIGREFYGDFGDFDVTIHIDKAYIVAASGLLQDPNSIGFGYEDPGAQVSEPISDKIIWRFVAKNVHDFVWAADPDYRHTRFTRKDGTQLHFFFQETADATEAWTQLPHIIDEAFGFMNAHIGQYPYPTFSFIQGGDGGMEYPMATLLSGNRTLHSLVGVAVHELAHSWYHGVLATNELLYAWMDEGFTNYATSLTMQYLYQKGLLKDESALRNLENDYQNYVHLAQIGIEEPMSTHADHFATNTAYFAAAYAKGNVFLAQLEYIIGVQAMQRTLLRYFATWKFKHPTPKDFIRIAELESGLVLDWYYEYWILSTKTINYTIRSVVADGNETRITLQRTGAMPMPIEVYVATKREDKAVYYIPLDLMRGHKPPTMGTWTVLDYWQWTNPEYTLVIPIKYTQIMKVEIDPTSRLADIDVGDNIFLREEE